MKFGIMNNITYAFCILMTRIYEVLQSHHNDSRWFYLNNNRLYVRINTSTSPTGILCAWNNEWHEWKFESIKGSRDCVHIIKSAGESKIGCECIRILLYGKIPPNTQYVIIMFLINAIQLTQKCTRAVSCFAHFCSQHRTTICIQIELSVRTRTRVICGQLCN